MSESLTKTIAEDLSILEGVADPIKVKLLELKTQLDKVESVVNKIDSKSIQELQMNLRIKNYMTRISDISEAEKNKNPLKLDKASAGRIIKRSLWQKAMKKSKEEPLVAAEFDGTPKGQKRASTEETSQDEPKNKKRSP